MASYKEISNYLTDKEKLGLRNDVKKRITKIYNALPDDSIFKIASLSGIAKRGWYARASESIKALLGNDSNLFSALLASTSPQQSVKLNLLMTIKIYGEYKKLGSNVNIKAIKNIAKLSDLKARRHNVIRSFNNEAISGFKVSSFLCNLTGDLKAVTIDTWMLNFGDLKKYSAQSKYVYLAYTAKIRKVAKDMNLEPAEVQETIWSYIYSKENKVSIKDVPEFSDLLTSDDNIKRELASIV